MVAFGCCLLTLFQPAVLAAQDHRRPTIQELFELAEHVRSLPPTQFDVTVLVEFDLDPVAEAKLSKSVRNILSRLHRGTEQCARLGTRGSRAP